MRRRAGSESGGSLKNIYIYIHISIYIFTQIKLFRSQKEVLLRFKTVSKRDVFETQNSFKRDTF